MPRIRQAVILAAGMGVRLRELGQTTPKGLLCLGERPIVLESIERLVAEGIERVVIVTGHHAGRFEELAAARPQLVCTAHNPLFAESGSLYSLWCARERLAEGDFLLLESDIVYERRALRVLLDHPSPDVLLLSEPTGAHDAVWVEGRDGCLWNMSKDRAALGKSIAGELVGITRVSQAFLGSMLAVGEELFRETRKVDYELQGLVLAARQRPLRLHLEPDLLWAEIDDPLHLERARERIYPELLRRDALPAHA